MIGADTGVERIAAAFAAAPGRAALMPYVMGGFPDIETSVRMGEACADNGADLIELGVPFSDPLADGPVIQAVGARSLAAGTTLPKVIEAGRRIAERVPVVLMCYANPILARGLERFTAELAEQGISGLIVPDVPMEEAAAFRAACDASGLALVPLVAPTSTDARLEAIASQARGFIYTVAVVGITGERSDMAAGIERYLSRVRAHADVPVALGFGISTADHARAAAQAGAEGVIFASRLMREAMAAVDAGQDPVAVVGASVAELAAGLSR
jgi:tryptophan synthase alpha chain